MSSSSSCSSSSSACSGRWIKLRRSTPREYVEGRTQGYLLKFEVIDACNVDPEIFVFQRKPAVLPGGQTRDEFSNIASPADLEEYPVGAPTYDSPFYRLDSVELVFRDLELAEEAAADIERDITGLMEALDNLDCLQEETVVLSHEIARPAIICESPVLPAEATPSSSDCSSSSSNQPIVYSVTLKRSAISQYVEGRTQGYLLQLEVVEAIGLSPAIFLFQRKVATQTNRDEFSNIASPADLEEFPIGAPDDEKPFYRLSEVSLVFRDLELLEQSYNDLKRDICGLVESLAQMHCLQDQEIVTINREACTAQPCPVGPPITARVVAYPRDPGPNDDAEAGYGVGSIWSNTTNCNVWSLQDNTNGEAVWCLVNTTGGTLTDLNKDMPALATSSDGDLATSTPLTVTPFEHSYIMVSVNDHGASLGDGVKTKDCYYSRDGGATALPVQDLLAGDQLYWNGSIAGYELEVDDLVSFNYIS